MLKNLSSFLINDEKLGIIAPIIKFKRDKKTVYDYGGNLNWWLGRPKHQEKTQFFKHKLIFPEYVSGCCMLIKKEVFDKIGFFDEKFFLNFEDVDFCLRAQKAGFKLVINPQAVILHNLNEQRSWFKKYHLLTSNLIFINKYIVWWRRPIALFYWVFLTVKLFLS